MGSIFIIGNKLKFYLEFNNFKNKFNLNCFGYLKFILMIENTIYQLKNT